MNRLRKQLKSKKGFTLVEIIIVLVILAALMAITLPSLTGYIDEANERVAMVEARTAYAALQTLASLEKVEGTGQYISSSGLTSKGASKLDGLIADGNIKYATRVSSIKLGSSYSITGFVYTQPGGYKVTFATGKYEVAK